MVRQQGLSRADRHTLLRLMADPWYQQTKLGVAFPPHKQQRSSQFWRLAAAYLGQPLLAVMLAGGRLRAGAGQAPLGGVARDVLCLLAFPGVQGFACCDRGVL